MTATVLTLIKRGPAAPQKVEVDSFENSLEMRVRCIRVSLAATQLLLDRLLEDPRFPTRGER